MGKAKKVSKNNPDNKKQSRLIYKSKDECEKCQNRCKNGKRHIDKMNKTGQGRGAICYGN